MMNLAGSLRGSPINFDMVTVGATINVMLAACRGAGQHGADQRGPRAPRRRRRQLPQRHGRADQGAGTDTIRIRGVEKLHGGTYTVIPDQIETGTLMIAAAATRGDVAIRGTIPTHMEALTAKLLEMGVSVQSQDDVISVRIKRPPPDPPVHAGVPGFPTGPAAAHERAADQGGRAQRGHREHIRQPSSTWTRCAAWAPR